MKQGDEIRVGELSMEIVRMMQGCYYMTDADSALYEAAARHEGCWREEPENQSNWENWREAVSRE